MSTELLETCKGFK